MGWWIPRVYIMVHGGVPWRASIIALSGLLHHVRWPASCAKGASLREEVGMGLKASTGFSQGMHRQCCVRCKLLYVFISAACVGCTQR